MMMVVVTMPWCQDIREELLQFEEAGTLRGKLTASAQADMISGTDSLEACVKGAKYIQVFIDKDMESFSLLFFN